MPVQASPRLSESAECRFSDLWQLLSSPCGHAAVHIDRLHPPRHCKQAGGNTGGNTGAVTMNSARGSVRNRVSSRECGM
jgi:hypothetical protein